MGFPEFSMRQGAWRGPCGEEGLLPEEWTEYSWKYGRRCIKNGFMSSKNGRGQRAEIQIPGGGVLGEKRRKSLKIKGKVAVENRVENVNNYL